MKLSILGGVVPRVQGDVKKNGKANNHFVVVVVVVVIDAIVIVFVVVLYCFWQGIVHDTGFTPSPPPPSPSP